MMFPSVVFLSCVRCRGCRHTSTAGVDLALRLDDSVTSPLTRSRPRSFPLDPTPGPSRPLRLQPTGKNAERWCGSEVLATSTTRLLRTAESWDATLAYGIHLIGPGVNQAAIGQQRTAPVVPSRCDCCGRFDCTGWRRRQDVFGIPRSNRTGRRHRLAGGDPLRPNADVVMKLRNWPVGDRFGALRSTPNPVPEGGNRCSHETVTRPAYRAGSTSSNPTPTPRWPSTVTCSVGPSKFAPPKGAPQRYAHARLDGLIVAGVGGPPTRAKILARGRSRHADPPGGTTRRPSRAEPDELSKAFWHACAAGQRRAAE